MHVENLKELNYGNKIGDISNSNNNGNNNDNNFNNVNNINNQEHGQGQSQYPNINSFQDDYGIGGESEEDILKMVLELSKKEF